ncbi:MAG: SdrD B-like domain-containing protein [Planctomycetaceae bacterium]
MDRLYERLEDRVLFDAAPDATVDPNAATANGDQENANRFDVTVHAEDVKSVADASLLPSNTSAAKEDFVAAATRELVIVDTSLVGHEQLVADILSDENPLRRLDVREIDGTQDGIAQISQILSEYSDLNAVHVVSHGSDTSVQLGNVWLSNENVGSYAGEIAIWGRALESGGDLLFYGCDIAATADGRQLLQSIGTLTGADIAASIDPTGFEPRGGDWNLEYVLGAMQTSVAFSDAIQRDWRFLMAPGPEVTLTPPAASYLGDTVTFEAVFSNTGTNTGYGPYLDLIFPANGVDGDAGTSTPDGIEFLSASYLGSPLTATELVFPDDGGGTGTIAHPFAVDSAGNPLQITGTAGDKLVVISLPFSSFVPGQAPLQIDIQAKISELADPYDGTAATELTVRARAGFQYGSDEFDNPSVDPTVVSDTQSNSSNWVVSASTQPTLLTIRKTYSGPEAETVTGPNFVNSYTIAAFLAEDQAIDGLTLTDNLPNTHEYIPGSLVVSVGSTVLSASDYTILSQPSTPGAQNAPNNQLSVHINPTVLGLGGDVAAAMLTFDFTVPQYDADGNPILSALTGNDLSTSNDAVVSGQWTPIDPRDLPTQTVTSNATLQDYTLTQKSIAIQKTTSIAVNAGYSGNSPGDTLQHVLNFQVSDYFAFDNVVITDTLGDGQDWYSDHGADTTEVMVPTLQLTQHGVTIGTLAFDAANYSVTESADGTTTIVFRVSDQLRATALAASDPNALNAGRILGGWISDAGTGGGPPDGSFNQGATTGTVVYRTVILESFKAPGSNDGSVDQGDHLVNDVDITADLLDVSDLSLNGESEADGSGTEIEIATGSLSKYIYAINGNTNGAVDYDTDGDGHPNLAAGDLVTYRIRYFMPTSDVEDLKLTDFLPLPTFDVSGMSATRIASPGPGTVPGENQWQLGPTDTFTGFYEATAADADSYGGTATVELSVNPTTNSFVVGYGTVDDPSSSSRWIDLLFTVAITDRRSADGLSYSNQAVASEDGTFGTSTSTQAVSTHKAEVQQPALNIRKGIIDSSDTAAFTAASVSFAETSATASPYFTGTINSTWLDATALTTALGNLDAGDTTRFIVIVENTGTARTGAFDVTVNDLLPTGMTYVSGSLQVFDGTGAALSYTLANGTAATDADFFGAGLRLSDPGATPALADRTNQGALDEFDLLDGRNVAIFIYDVTLDQSVEPTEALTNTASLTSYANLEGGSNFLRAPETAESDVTVRNVASTKSIVGTSEAHTGVDSGIESVTIGELVRYRLAIEIPEGTTQGLVIRDLLPSGLTFIDDGTAKISLVSNSGTMTSSILSGAGLNQMGDDASLSSLTPSFVLPDGSISAAATSSDNDAWTTGGDPYFKVGTIVNNDNDSNKEYLVIEFNALVDNHSGSGQNNLGNTRYNDLEIYSDTDANGSVIAAERLYEMPDANRPRVRIVEPQITNFAKSVDFASGDAGDVVTYNVAFRVASGTNYSDAYDVHLTDIIPSAGLTMQAGSLVVKVGATTLTPGVDYVDSSSGNTIDILLAHLAEGAIVEVTYKATIVTSVHPTDVYTNTANVTWTSIPGDNGTDAIDPGNSTGSDLASLNGWIPPGETSSPYATSSGQAQGERDGSGTTSTPQPNDYRATSSANVTIKSTTLTKTLVGTSIDDSAGAGDNVGNEAVIGEVVTYTVTLDFSEAVLPNARLVDTLDAGMAFIGVIGFNTTDVTLDATVDLSAPVVTNGGRTVTWDLKTIQDTTPGDSQSTGNTDGKITITYQAVVTNVQSNQDSPATNLNNSVNFQWDDDAIVAPNPRESLTASAANVSVIEPRVTVGKTVALDTDGDSDYDDGKIGDAGDAIQYTITISNISGVDAFDIGFLDQLPILSDGSSAILSATLSSVSDNATSGDVSSSDFELVGGDATGYTLRSISGANIDLLATQGTVDAAPRVITLVVRGVISPLVAPNQAVTNSASVTWTSLDGTPGDISTYTTDDTERSGTNAALDTDLNNYVAFGSDAFSVSAPVFTKQLFATDQTETSGSNVTIGEQVTYALIVSLPEGVTPDATIVDQLPAGLRHVSYQIVTTATDSFDASGNQLLSSDFNGTFSSPLPTVTGGVSDGDDVTFIFGQIDVTPDNLSGNNNFLILVRAVVTDVGTNTGYVGNQHVLSNTATIDFATDSQPPLATAAVNVTVVEPNLTITKEFGPTVNVDTANAGDTVTVNLTVSNTTGTATAYDVTVQDMLSSSVYDFTSLNLGTAGSQYPANFVANFASGTGALTYTGGSIAAGSSVTFSFSIKLLETLTPGDTHTNTADITHGSTLEGTVAGERDDPDADGDNSDTASDTVRIRSNSLAGFVWNDINNNGLKEVGETGIAGVNVRLQGTDNLGNSVDVTLSTTATGAYQFDKLRPGTYSISEDPNLNSIPAGYLDGKDSIGTPGGNASSNDLFFNINLPAATETQGQNNNFGEIRASSLAGFVYHDANNNGVKNSGETGISGVTITLTGTDDLGNSVSLSTTTDSNGAYQFTNLRPSNVVGYTLRETAQPVGYLDGRDRDGSLNNGNAVSVNDEISSIDVVPGNTGTAYNFGELRPSSLSGYVYHDSNNDGLRSNEPTTSGISGVQITLTGTNDLGQAVSLSTTTDAVGYYEFTNLRPSNATGYTIAESAQPAGYLDGRDTIGTPGGNATVNDRFSQIVVTSGTTGAENNFGELNPASLTGTVFNDFDNDGLFEPLDGEVAIQGVTVTLTGTNDLGQAVNLSTTTAANGTYSFTNLRPSNSAGYTLTETQPTAYTDGQDRDGSLNNGDVSVNDRVTSINVVSGDTGTTYTFGERGTSITGVVYVDDNRNGTLDAGEATRVGGVTIQLYDMTNPVNPVLVATTTSATNGTYRFDNLPAGNYRLVETQPAQYGSVSPNTLNFALPLTGSTNNNFGEALYDLGDTIYFDANNNGVQDLGEQGIGNVGVTLRYAGADGVFGNSDDPPAITATTTAAGSYRFNELYQGNYTVTVNATDLPAGMNGTAEVDDSASSIDGVSHITINNGDRFDVDFGYAGTLSIGDTFWFDTDGNDLRNLIDTNGDSTLDSLEPGIPGVSVNLVFAGADGNFATTMDNLTLTTTTDANGAYRFDNLPRGNYRISFDTTDIPAGLAASVETDDNGPTVDGVANILLNTASRSDVDFGFIGRSELGDLVWFDYDGNGTRNQYDSNDDGTPDTDEPVFANVDIRIVWAGFDGDFSTAADNVVFYETTDDNGNYKASGLADGSYRVSVEMSNLPVGISETHEVDGTVDNLANVTIAGDNRLDVDFGFNGSGRISDQLWNDVNRDGLFNQYDSNGDGVPDTDEPGLESVPIKAVFAGTDGLFGTVDDFTLYSLSDSNGQYVFDNLPAGLYQVVVDDSVLPTGYVNTYDKDDVGGTPHDGVAVVELAFDEVDSGVDFGFAGDHTIGNVVWFDRNGDGVQNDLNTPLGEPGLAGVTVQLTYAGTDGSFGTVDDVVRMAVTAVDGSYLFDKLMDGDYRIRINASTLPTGMVQTFELDGNSLGNLDNQSDITLSGASRDDIDFGYRGTSSIGDRVWFDHNADGVQVTDEPGLSNIPVQLTFAGLNGVFGDADDFVIGTVTDANGNYLFDALPEGNYSVAITAPANSTPTYDLDGLGTPNSSSVTISSPNVDELNVDFGLRGTSQVGDTVFFDENGDGVQNNGEVGIPGVTVQLEIDLDGDTIADFTTTTLTDQTGRYLFDHLLAGNVVVSVTPPPVTIPTANHDANLGGDAQHTFNLPSGIVDLTSDFGFLGTGSIGDSVFFDANVNGLQDDGSSASPREPGLPGVPVQLDIDFNRDGVIDRTLSTVTSATGVYRFDNLPAGDYRVRVTPPAGTMPTFDASGALDHQSELTLASGENNSTQDFGYTGNGAITDTVFFDIDGDGRLDPAPTDRALPGVHVTLTIDLDHDGVIDYTQTVVTDQNGVFTFGHLVPGTYTISVGTQDLPAGLANNPTVDNDGVTTRSTAQYVLPANQTVSGPGFGYHATPDYQITKTTLSQTAQPGDTIRYVVRVRNNGELDGRNIVVTDNYPTSLMSISDSTGGIVDATHGTITWNLAAMQPGDEVLLIVTATLNSTVRSEVTQVMNVVSVTDDGYNGQDPTPGNNTASVTSAMLAAPDYETTVTDNLDKADPGDSVQYIISVKNVGNQDGTGVVVTSQLIPELMRNVQPSHGGVYDPVTGIITWHLGDLDVGELVFLTIDAEIVRLPPFGFDYTANLVHATDDGLNGVDPTPSNNTSEDTTQLTVFAFDSFHDFSGGNKYLDEYNQWHHEGINSDPYRNRLRPLPVDSVYTGIVDPGTTLQGKIYDQQGRLIGEQTVVADSAGNWLMQFPTLVLNEHPYEMRITQTPSLQNESSNAGFNLRRFFHPAIHSQLFCSEPLSVASVFSHDPYSVLRAMHAANNHPLGFGWNHYDYEMEVSSSNAASH